MKVISDKARSKRSTRTTVSVKRGNGCNILFSRNMLQAAVSEISLKVSLVEFSDFVKFLKKVFMEGFVFDKEFSPNFASNI